MIRSNNIIGIIVHMLSITPVAVVRLMYMNHMPIDVEPTVTAEH